MKQVKLSGGSGSYSNNGVEFELSCSFSYIKIKSIILDTLCSKDNIGEWLSKLQQSKVYLQIEYEGDYGISGKTITHYLLTDVTGQHQIPVFNYDDWCLPKENVRNISGKNFYKKLKIKIYSNLYDFRATVIYEDSPGVKVTTQSSY